jgi:LysM repeat protein
MRRWLFVILALMLMAVLPAAAQDEDVAGTTYVVAEGDTLLSIAVELNKPVLCIRTANDLPALPSLEVGQELFIPDDCDALLEKGGGAAEPAESTVTQAAVLEDQTYIVQRGDWLATIAAEFGTTVACLVQANNIRNPDLIYVGQELLITASCQGGGGGTGVDAGGGDPNTVPAVCQWDRNSGREAPNGQYRVRAGDTLDFIACDFGIALDCLVQTNPEIDNRGRLGIGDVLLIDLSCPAWEPWPGA